MKWFQVDSDTPDDPRIRDVVRELGAAGLGGLFLLWCHIANHGSKRPGWSLRTDGKPMPEEELIDASKLASDEFARLVSICAQNGHFDRRAWTTRKVIAIPAMSRRADTYTKRRVRTRVDDASKQVPLQDKTVQDSTRKKKERGRERPPAPPSDPADNYRVITKLASIAVREFPTVQFSDLSDVVKSRCAEAHIPYDSEVVRKAIDSAQSKNLASA
jgi:hypothetical protein